MRVIRSTSRTKEECLRRALEYEWMAENSPAPNAAAYAWNRARLWRSLSYVADPSSLAQE
jgi:hypothetical protein